MCASEHKNDHKFMAFFDIDEFLVLKKHATVGEMVEKHLKDGSLTISQHIFGTGNADNYGTLPVTKRFAYRDGVGKNDSHEDGNMVKSILKLSDYSGYPKVRFIVIYSCIVFQVWHIEFSSLMNHSSFLYPIKESSHFHNKEGDLERYEWEREICKFP